MPCNSDYLEPTAREKELRRAANLYRYVLSHLNRHIPDAVFTAMVDPYCKEDFIPDLCDVVSKMTKTQQEKIIYNAHNSTSRDLADWWEDHQRADAERIVAEQKELNRKATAATVAAKLTDDEREALGIDDQGNPIN